MKDETLQPMDPEKIYDRLAKKNQYNDIVDYKLRIKILQKALSFIDSPYKSVLDLATGTGAMIDALLNKKNLSIIGIDISPEMLSIAKKRLGKLRNITLKVQDFINVTFPSNKFDLITISYSTRFIPKDKEDIFAQNIKKWLKKDGVFLAIFMDSPQEKIVRLLYKKTGYPKGYNHTMNFIPTFIMKMKPHLFHEKTISLSRQLLFWNSKAVYFKK